MISTTPPQNAPEVPRSEPTGMGADSSNAGAYAALLRASETAQRLALQTQTQWVVSTQSKVAQLFGVERKS